MADTLLPKHLRLKHLKMWLSARHPRNWARMRREDRERNHNHCHILSTDPPIVYLWWGRDDTFLHQQLADKKLVVLYLFPWCTTEENIEPICQQIKARLKRFKNHRIVLLCNEEFTVPLFREQDVEAIFCNQNCFINENVYTILPEVKKEYDAIYNASMAPYKRHQLAANISSLLLMTYRYSGTHMSDYEKSVRESLAHASWAKDSYGDDDKVSAEDMAAIYNRARVGLCLSKVEGSMFASMEYLLCGLPVVSTVSQGGRDTFFDPAYVEIVDDTAKAVAFGVEQMLQRAPSGEIVRARTLEKVMEHRGRLLHYLRSDAADIHIPWPPGSHGPNTFMHFNKVVERVREAPRKLQTTQTH